MDREEMSNEENYAFDVAGYLHVPGVLSRGEVETLNRALDEGCDLKACWAGRYPSEICFEICWCIRNWSGI